MEFRGGNSPMRHSQSKQGTPRNDRQQPIIIQNFELLTPNQLKFKRKSLSTANLYLSSASLSRQATWSKENRPASEQPPNVLEYESQGRWLSGSDLGMVGHQSYDFALRAQVDHAMKPSALSSSSTEKNGPRKQVTFADNLSKPYSFVSEGKFWRPGNSEGGSSKSTTDINNNARSDKDTSNQRGGRNVKKDISTGQRTQIWHTSTNSLGRKDTITSDKRSQGLALSGEASISEVGRGHNGHNWPSGNNHFSREEMSVVDHENYLTAHKSSAAIVSLQKEGSDSREHGSTRLDSANCMEKEGHANITGNVQTNALSSKQSHHSANGAKYGDGLESGATETPVPKSKRVSFNLVDGEHNEENDDEDDKNSVTAHVGDTSDLWYEAERLEHPVSNASQQSNDQDQTQGTPMSGHFMGPSNEAGISAHRSSSTVRPSSGHNSAVQVDRSTKLRGSSKHKSNTGTKDISHDFTEKNGGPRVIRLNFLKDEFDIYRRLEDPLHPINQRKLEKNTNQAKDTSEGFNPQKDMNVQGVALHSNLNDAGRTIPTKPSITSRATSAPVRNTNQIKPGEPAGLSSASESEKPKTRGEINTDFLMQIYSASGDRKPVNEVAEVSIANEPPENLEASGRQGESQHVRSNSIDGRTVGKQRDPFAFSPRAREKERRLLSATPFRASRSLERPSVRSSSAMAMESSGRSRMTAAERFLLETTRRMVQRTALNKRLEELVVSSVQFKRSRTGLERARTNIS